MRVLVVTCLMLLMTACESNPPAPVIERTPQASKPKPPVPSKPIDAKTAASKDWRPDSHIVKKGDTLFSISLEYGIYYKDIATANNIAPPYPIKIGQKLDLSSFKTKAAVTIDPAKTDVGKSDDGVVVTPMKVEAVTTVTATKPSNATNGGSAVTPVLTEPKATREPYSVDAWNHAVPTKATDTKPSDSKQADAKPSRSEERRVGKECA